MKRFLSPFIAALAAVVLTPATAQADTVDEVNFQEAAADANHPLVTEVGTMDEAADVAPAKAAEAAQLRRRGLLGVGRACFWCELARPLVSKSTYRLRNLAR
jgi:hypothetical protein